MPDRTPLHNAIKGAADPLAVMDRVVARAVLLVPGEIMRTDDAVLDDRVNLDGVRLTGVRSMLCVPVHGGPHGGSLHKVSSRQVAAFQDDDVTTLQELAAFLDVIVRAASDIANVMRPGLIETVEGRQRSPDRSFADARSAGLGVELELLALRSAHT